MNLKVITFLYQAPRARITEEAQIEKAILGCFFGLGLESFVGCVQKCIRMYWNVSERIGTYRNVFLCPLASFHDVLKSVISALCVQVVLGCFLDLGFGSFAG